MLHVPLINIAYVFKLLETMCKLIFNLCTNSHHSWHNTANWHPTPQHLLWLVSTNINFSTNKCWHIYKTFGIGWVIWWSYCYMITFIILGKSDFWTTNIFICVHHLWSANWDGKSLDRSKNQYNVTIWEIHLHLWVRQFSAKSDTTRFCFCDCSGEEYVDDNNIKLSYRKTK